MKTLKLGIAAAFCAACFAGSATAMTMSPSTYTQATTDVCDYVLDVEPDADDCFGSTVENANAQQVDLNNDIFVTGTTSVTGMFGYQDWTTFQSVPTVGGDQKSGTISVDTNMFDEVLVLLKSSNTFSAYLFENGLNGDLGFWTANDKGLSNYIIAGRGEMSDIPLPAAGWLLIAGLGGLAAMKRRKS